MKLREYLEKYNISRIEFAKKLGVSLSYIDLTLNNHKRKGKSSYRNLTLLFKLAVEYITNKEVSIEDWDE